MTSNKATTPFIPVRCPARSEDGSGFHIGQQVVVDQTGKPLTHAQHRALLRALRHGEPYHLFPMPLRGDAGGLVCIALIRRGLATDKPAPILTVLGIQETCAVLARGHDRANSQAKGN